MSQRLSVVLFAVGSLVVGACGDDDGGDDDKVVTDSGSPTDGGIDAAAPKDAGTDAKVNIDAATDAATDAGSLDAAVDATAVADSAVVTDTGTADTGTADASSDAGDAGGDAGDAGAVAVKPSVAGQIVITEIQAAPLGYADDSLAEWIEIYNPSTTTTYDLGTCTFGDKAGDADFTFVANTTIAPLAYLTLSSNTLTVPLHGFVSDVVYGAAGTGLSGSGDGPNIVCTSIVIDKVDYNATNGFALPESMQGRTLQLSSSKLDATQNDMGASWCFSTTVFQTSTTDAGITSNFGSPKAANAACP